MGRAADVGTHGHGKTPKVYYLTRKGYELLRREGDIPEELLGSFVSAHQETTWSPQMYHRLKVTAGGKRRVEHLPRKPTYEYQLEAFCAAVLDGAPTLTPPSESIANMRVIDDIYRAAGMEARRGVTD